MTLNNKFKSKKTLLASSLIVLLTACGSGNSGNSVNNNGLKTATFVDSAVTGLTYICKDKSGDKDNSGKTNAKGQFNYVAGDTCSFSLAGLKFGDVSMDSLIGDDVMVMPSTITKANKNKEMMIASILQTLNSNGNADNGIDVRNINSITLPAKLLESKDQATFNKIFSPLAATASGKKVVSFEEAQKHLNKSLAKLPKTVLEGIWEDKEPIDDCDDKYRSEQSKLTCQNTQSFDRYRKEHVEIIGKKYTDILKFCSDTSCQNVTYIEKSIGTLNIVSQNKDGVLKLDVFTSQYSEIIKSKEYLTTQNKSSANYTPSKATAEDNHCSEYITNWTLNKEVDLSQCNGFSDEMLGPFYTIVQLKGKKLFFADFEEVKIEEVASDGTTYTNSDDKYTGDSAAQRPVKIDKKHFMKKK